MIREIKGMNNVSSDFAVGQEYARNIHNFDLGRNVGALTRRYGYDSITAISSSNSDSLKNPYGVYLPDGRQFLVYVTDLKSSRFGEVQAGVVNSTNISGGNTIAPRWGIKTQTTYAMQNGILFMANGQNRMVAYDVLGGKFGAASPDPFGNGGGVTYARPIPPYAPGEVEIYPLLDTAGAGILYGDYMWAVVLQDSGAAQTRRVGYLTPRMRMDSGRAMIMGLNNFFVAESLATTAPIRYIKLYRTKANPGPITQFTTLFKTGDSVKFPGGAGTVIDDTPDGSLVVADSVMPSQFKTNHWNDPARPGQPRIIRRVPDTVDVTTKARHGLALGTKNVHIMKWAWVCTFVDTSFNAESDTGTHIELDSIITFANDSDWTTIKSVTLSVPKPNSSYTHMGINIYRAPMYYSLLDTAFKLDTNMVVRQSGHDTSYHEFKYGRKVTTKDTSIFGPFRLIGHLTSSDSIFVDTFSLNQWSGGQILRQNRPPSGINNLTSYGGRIFGSAGSRLYMSLLDSGSFAQMRFIEINRDNGDEITGIVAGRRAMRIFEGGSSYNVYQDDGGNWSRSEISSGIGCIAPRSIAQSALGTYYLSGKGVVLENDGQYIERTQATQLVSAPLKNFDLLPMATKRTAVGICVDNKYLLCIGDTTYVWDEKAQGWSTWSMKFSGATLYGVDANINFVRPDTMYFVQPNSRTLYRYKTSNKDNGVNFTAKWRSAPLLLDNQNKTISALGVWSKEGHDGYDITKFEVLDELANTVVASATDTNFGVSPAAWAPRYNRLSLGTNLIRGLQIDFTSTNMGTNTEPPLVIDGIDIYYHRQGGIGEK
jgi:hypothetical protein